MLRSSHSEAHAATVDEVYVPSSLAPEQDAVDAKEYVGCVPAMVAEDDLGQISAGALSQGRQPAAFFIYRCRISFFQTLSNQAIPYHILVYMSGSYCISVTN